MELWTAALLKALLLHVGGHMWQVVCISWCFKSRDFLYGSHLVTVGWIASLVVIADGATSTKLSSLFCELCFICVFDMYVLFMCSMSVFFFLVCTHAQWVSI